MSVNYNASVYSENTPNTVNLNDTEYAMLMALARYQNDACVVTLLYMWYNKWGIEVVEEKIRSFNGKNV